MGLLKVLSFMLLLGTVILGCTSSTAPKQIKQPGALTNTSLDKPSTGSQNEWDKVIDLAKKERKVTAYVSTLPVNAYRPISAIFQEKYGISVEFIAGRGLDIMQKVVTEHNAGLNISDVYETGVPTHLMLKERGLLEGPVRLPETVDVSNWINDPWIADKDRFMFSYYEYTPGPVINTDIIKPADEPKSWLDLLDPKWKGKIAWDDPSVPGPGAKNMSFMKWYVASDYWDRLAKNDVTFLRDRVFIFDSVVRGRYPIAAGVFTTAITRGVKDGAPIKPLYLKEGSPGAGWTISLIKNAPHPNAAKFFVNWFLSREGQLVFSKESEVASFRKDVSQDHVHPTFRLTPNMKIIPWTPEDETRQTKDMIMAAEFFKIGR